MSTRILASILARRAGGTGRHGARRRQQGAIIIMAALTLLLLLGFMGIALDFGRMFIVKTELQTALDSCALAAARELNGATDAITRAVSAGSAAGNQNGVNLQSPNWSGQGQITSADISFLDKNYAATTTPASAVYSQCTHTQSNISLWLMQAMGAFSGNTAGFPATGTVGTSAVATRTSAQSACPIPVALQAKTAGASKPDYGYTAGDWVTVLSKSNGGSNFGWANLDGSNSASETAAELNGHCGSKIGDTLGTSGVKASVVEVWNYRFGIYKNNADPSVDRPDYTGYIYTTSNWPAGRSAYNGSSGSTPNFLAQRLAFTPCGSDPSQCGMQGGGFKTVATSAQLKSYGADRRVVIVPIVNASNQLIDFACMLMLQPMTIPVGDVQLEYLGNAGSASSPCTTSGLPGGTAGPLVPVLVR
ncbi:MAG: hypothetical protein JO200_07695 [Comamonas sp.]|nr:hypothetical protein [Comamonas sp.]